MSFFVEKNKNCYGFDNQLIINLKPFLNVYKRLQTKLIIYSTTTKEKPPKFVISLVGKQKSQLIITNYSSQSEAQNTKK